MRVISGKLKGRKLFVPKDLSIRPTTDRIKEALFNILQTKIVASNFLDLFSGSGGIGIEAFSRGANVTMCDKSGVSINLIKKNLEMCGVTGVEVYNLDYKVLLNKLAGHRFDIIFLDPPYIENCLDEILKLIDSNSLIEDSGCIIYECAKISLINIPKPYIITNERLYSSTKLVFIEREPK